MNSTMRKIFATLLLLQAFLPAAFSQQKKAINASRSNAIKLNLLSPFFSTLQLSYTRKITEETAFHLAVGYMDYTPESNKALNTKALFIAPEYRFYVENKLVEQLYISGFTRYIFMNYTSDNNYISYGSAPVRYTSKYHSLGLGVLFGKEFIIKNRLIIDMFAGPVYSIIVQGKSNFPGITTNEVKIDDNFSQRLVKNYGVRGGFTVGYLF